MKGITTPEGMHVQVMISHNPPGSTRLERIVNKLGPPARLTKILDRLVAANAIGAVAYAAFFAFFLREAVLEQTPGISPTALTAIALAWTPFLCLQIVLFAARFAVFTLHMKEVSQMALSIENAFHETVMRAVQVAIQEAVEAGFMVPSEPGKGPTLQ